MISPQSQKLYKILLSSDKPIDAKQLAEKLGIFPATVYRLTEPLVGMGLISQVSNYPYRFIAKPISEGLSLFLLNQTNWFSRQFTSPVQKQLVKTNRQIFQPQQINISFIQSRDELMRLSVGEVNKSGKTVDLLRSGHEIPANLMLALVEAKRRGVQTRMLIQDYSPKNAEQVAYWQRNGILVRRTALRHIRLMLYDSQALYFMSYKHTDSKEDLGMKINYPPFAVILSQLFNQWWKTARSI